MKWELSFNISTLLLVAALLIGLANCQNDKPNDASENKPGENTNQKSQDNKPAIQPLSRMPNANLYYSKECQDDITRYCPKAKNAILTDMAVLQCIHNEVADLNLIDKPCHNVIFFLNFYISELIYTRKPPHIYVNTHFSCYSKRKRTLP
jgi:hypothetical protein